MSKYKLYSLACNESQNPMELLSIIEEISQKQGYKARRYKTEEEDDSLDIEIQKKPLPISRLVLFIKPETASVDMINLGSIEEGKMDRLGPDDFNTMTDSFCHDVFAEIQLQDANDIKLKFIGA